MRRTNKESHRFFCMKCGQESMPLARSSSLRREALHRKKLWCYHCKLELNHIECKTIEEIELFKINFENGVYKDEAEESLAHVRSTSKW